ncbi:hypothetical protein E4K72_07505 [Oxalobacteraceae bacterium OM1]|nr:hypothetical protein E4K72_07505 [Oxalobacteraceae bacterium OM1]
MDISEAIQHALDGNAILFVGSGFSFGAKNAKGTLPLSGRSIAKHLYELAGVEAEDDNLELASQMYVDAHGASALNRLIREMYTINEPAQWHVDLAAVRWRRIYTTNYDNLLEIAAVKSGRVLTPVDLNDAPEKYISDANVCVHINGFIDRLGATSLNNEFKLTFESYLKDDFTPSKWSTVFRNDLALARAVIFIGYSMYDQDIRRIVFAEDIQSKTLFVAAPDLKPTSVDAKVLPKFGQLAPIGVGGFAERLTNVKANYTPRKEPEGYLALQKVEAVAPLRQIRNSDIEQLFLYGDLSAELVPLGSSSPERDTGRYYVVDRAALQQAEDALKERDVVLTSELGNGKTVLLEQLAVRMASKGWEVFRLLSDNKETRKELERLVRTGSRILIIADPYIPLLDVIDFVSIRRQGKEIRFALTARTNIHDAFIDRLENALRTTVFTEIDLNRLSSQDATALIGLTDSFGLWADFSGSSDSEKVKIVLRESEAQFHQFLLKLYAAPQISAKVNELFKEIGPNVKRIVIATFILKGVGIRVDKSYLNDLLKGQSIFHISNADKSSLKVLWQDSPGEIRLKSSVMAEYYLTHLADASEVIGVLKEMFANAHALQNITADYTYFMRGVMSYSALQRLLPKQGLRAATIDFYEEIQTLRIAQKNPHYWLQYAIARLSLEDDLEVVENYFKSAYSYAKEVGYDTYQIDNHYARLLLAKAQKSKNASDAFVFFDQAQQIIQRQILREQKHYPYRVAKNVLDFFREHGAQLSGDQIKRVRTFAEDVLKRIEKLPVETRDHRHVVVSKKALDTLLKEIEAAFHGPKPKG